MEDKKVNISHTISLALLKNSQSRHRLSALSRKSSFQSDSSSKAANKPRNTREPHLFNLSNCKKVIFFQCYSQNYTKWTENKAIQVSQMPWIKLKTTDSGAWYFVTGFVIGTAHSPYISPLDFWFWGAMDRLIHLQKLNSILALKRLINEAARDIS